jgi:antitoxin component HigA of HigAB toxin-antitoxin module
MERIVSMPTTNDAKARTGRRRDAYLELVRAFPLRSIRTEAEAAAAGETVKRILLSKSDAQRDQGELDYLDALGDLILRYQSVRGRPALPARTPLGMLKHLMGERHMTVNDLGKVIGSQPAASMILSGKRSLSKAHVVKLGAHFAVSPAVLLDPKPT